MEGFASMECIPSMDFSASMFFRRVMDGKSTGAGSSYGVKNVHARLQLMFGEAYGLSYESKEGEGTCVTIRFPKAGTD